MLDPYRPRAGATRAKYRLMELQSLNWMTLNDGKRPLKKSNTMARIQSYNNLVKGMKGNVAYSETWSRVSFPSSTDTVTLSFTCSAARRAPTSHKKFRLCKSVHVQEEMNYLNQCWYKLLAPERINSNNLLPGLWHKLVYDHKNVMRRTCQMGPTAFYHFSNSES